MIPQKLKDKFNFTDSIKHKDIGNYGLYFFTQAAHKLGWEHTMIVPKSVMEIRKGNQHFLFKKTGTPLVNFPASDITGRKHQAAKVLAHYGVPTPKSFKVGSIEEMKKVYHTLNESVVVKPDQGLGGKGITILPDEEELDEAWEYKREYKSSKKVVIEEFIKGENYRLMVLGDKVIAAAKRLPAFVTGDGEHTIQELIKIENTKRENSPLVKIKIDDEVQRRLNLDNRKLNDVPTTGSRIYLRYNCNLSTGGITKECTNDIHPYYKELAVKACQSLKMEHGGVDLITPDANNPEVKHAINEINRTPGVRIHYFPTIGEPIDVGYKIVEYLVKR
jgi:cyanophycin synthetase